MANSFEGLIPFLKKERRLNHLRRSDRLPQKRHRGREQSHQLLCFRSGFHQERPRIP